MNFKADEICLMLICVPVALGLSALIIGMILDLVTDKIFQILKEAPPLILKWREQKRLMDKEYIEYKEEKKLTQLLKDVNHKLGRND